MFDLDEFLSLAEKQGPGRVKDAMLAAAAEIERVRKAWSFWKRALIDEYSAMLNATQEDRTRAIARAEKAEAELAATQGALEASERLASEHVESLLDTLSVVEIDNLKARVNDTLIPQLARMLTVMLIKDYVDGLYNYVEWDVGSTPEGGPLRLTIQRLDGKTASDLQQEAERELEAARAVVERAREWSRMGLYDPRLNDALAAYDAARRAGE